MLSQKELDEMAKAAKENLKNQIAAEEKEDIYADIRQEVDDSDNSYSEAIKNTPDSKEEYQTDFESIKTNEEFKDSNKQDIYIESDYNLLLFENGPSKALLDSWKKQWSGYGIFVVEIADITFVFRTLNRFEYKQIVALQNIDALQREEIICETVTLWPQNFNWESMASGMAGVPSTYAEVIMSKSGFTQEYKVQVL